MCPIGGGRTICVTPHWTASAPRATAPTWGTPLIAPFYRRCSAIPLIAPSLRALHNHSVPMTDELPDHDPEAAVECLQTLGLTNYTAQIYVGLLRLGTGTVREISELVDVPRPRVYDGLDALYERGLIDIQYATPRMFRAASPAMVGRHFQTEYDETIARLRDQLAALEPPSEQSSTPRVRTITGRETVAERVPDVIDGATDEIIYYCAEEFLIEGTIQRLDAAVDRGVTVRLLTASAAARERLQTALPDVAVIDAPWKGGDTAPARLLLVDRATALMSTVHHHSPAEETAVWVTGESTSLVALLTAVVDSTGESESN